MEREIITERKIEREVDRWREREIRPFILFRRWGKGTLDFLQKLHREGHGTEAGIQMLTGFMQNPQNTVSQQV